MKTHSLLLRSLLITGLILIWSNVSIATADDVVCSGCVGTSDVAANAITSGKIKNGTIKANDLAGNAITSGKIKNGEVKENDLASNAITSQKIKNGEVKSSDIAAGAVTKNKMSSGLRDTIDDLVAQVAAQSERLDKIEGMGLTEDDVAGTYKWTGFQIGLMDSREIENISFIGSINFSSDGTFTANLSGYITALSVYDGGSEPIADTESVALSGTWTLSGTSVTFVLSDGLAVELNGASGNSLLVGIAAGNVHTKHIILLTKL